jgi:thiol-disulfide isomerase/thioredoxin
MADAQFDGKVVLIVFAGSWCPNCHDAASFLATLYREYRERGLEIVALMFEHFGDFEKAAAAVNGLRAKFGIEYPTLIAGISDKESAAEKFPQLSGIRAFPTTLFMDRQGRVRRIYTGFSGPATGEHHTRLRQTFIEQIDKLLAENPGAAGAGKDADRNEEK